MANMKHPNFLFGLLAIFVAFVAIGFRVKHYNSTGDALLIVTGIMGLVTWVWGIIAVQRAHSLEGTQRMFWRIIVVAIPFFGAMLYYMLHSKKNTIVD